MDVSSPPVPCHLFEVDSGQAADVNFLTPYPERFQERRRDDQQVPDSLQPYPPGRHYRRVGRNYHWCHRFGRYVNSSLNNRSLLIEDEDVLREKERGPEQKKRVQSRNPSSLSALSLDIQPCRRKCTSVRGVWYIQSQSKTLCAKCLPFPLLYQRLQSIKLYNFFHTPAHAVVSKPRGNSRCSFSPLNKSQLGRALVRCMTMSLSTTFVGKFSVSHLTTPPANFHSK